MQASPALPAARFTPNLTAPDQTVGLGESRPGAPPRPVPLSARSHECRAPGANETFLKAERHLFLRPKPSAKRRGRRLAWPDPTRPSPPHRPGPPFAGFPADVTRAPSPRRRAEKKASCHHGDGVARFLSAHAQGRLSPFPLYRGGSVAPCFWGRMRPFASVRGQSPLSRAPAEPRRAAFFLWGDRALEFGLAGLSRA